MNFRKVTDAKVSKFKVGNLNDYINVINATNVAENSELTVDDFKELENEYDGEVLSYKVLSSEDEKAVKHFRINQSLILNIYKV